MKTHRFDIISFITGLVFTGIGLLFLLPRDVSEIWNVLVDSGNWLWPIALLMIGVAIIGSAFFPKRKRDDRSQTATVD